MAFIFVANVDGYVKPQIEPLVRDVRFVPDHVRVRACTCDRTNHGIGILKSKDTRGGYFLVNATLMRRAKLVVVKKKKKKNYIVTSGASNIDDRSIFRFKIIAN